MMVEVHVSETEAVVQTVSETPLAAAVSVVMMVVSEAIQVVMVVKMVVDSDRVVTISEAREATEAQVLVAIALTHGRVEEVSVVATEAAASAVADNLEVQVVASDRARQEAVSKFLLSLKPRVGFSKQKHASCLLPHTYTHTHPHL